MLGLHGALYPVVFSPHLLLCPIRHEMNGLSANVTIHINQTATPPVEEGLPRLVVLHVLEVGDVPELDLGVVRDGGDDVSGGADVEALDGVSAVVADCAKEAVRVEVDSAYGPVLARRYQHVLSHCHLRRRTGKILLN